MPVVVPDTLICERAIYLISKQPVASCRAAMLVAISSDIETRPPTMNEMQAINAMHVAMMKVLLKDRTG